MISVVIYINDQPIFTRTAVRVDGNAGEECQYEVDTGERIFHHYDDGAVVLAKKLLDTIKQPGEKEK